MKFLTVLFLLLSIWACDISSEDVRQINGHLTRINFVYPGQPTVQYYFDLDNTICYTRPSNGHSRMLIPVDFKTCYIIYIEYISIRPSEDPSEQPNSSEPEERL